MAKVTIRFQETTPPQRRWFATGIYRESCHPESSPHQHALSLSVRWREARDISLR